MWWDNDRRAAGRGRGVGIARKVAGGVVAATMVCGCTAQRPSPPALTGKDAPPLPAATAVATGSPTAATSRTEPSKPPTPATPVDRQFVFGHSVRGAPLVALEIGNPALPSVLVVGCIHGDERAGTAVVDQLQANPPSKRIHLWLVRSLNPDGQANATRTNVDGVDLNRNFPDRWKPLDRPGGPHYAGPHALSEPESKSMASLLAQIRPRVGIWFHQALNLIDVSQGPRTIENALAAALGMREAALTEYPGSAIGYEDHFWPHTAFAFELPAGQLTAARTQQMTREITVIGQRPAG